MGINMDREAVRVMAEDMVRALNNDHACNLKGQPMNTTFIKLSAVAIAFSMSVAIPAAYSKEKVRGKKRVSRTVDRARGIPRSRPQS